MEIRLTPWEIILRLIVSAAVGFVVGLDREKHSSAGLRTHMILAVGVCILTLVQVDMTAETIQWYMENPDYIGAVGTNTSRLTAQIVSGIGFLGSGLILIRNDKSVDGMTSAVSLWTVAGISISGIIIIDIPGRTSWPIEFTIGEFKIAGIVFTNPDEAFFYRCCGGKAADF